MPSHHKTFAIRPQQRRRGTALLVTMLVTTAVVAVVFMASEHTRAATVLRGMDEDRQRAVLAAESVAALVEAKLVARSGEAENLTTNLHENPALWWNLVGCSYTIGAMPVVPTRGLWIDGCVVRWRLEPVKIAAAIGVDGIDPQATFTVNREINPERIAEREAQARSGSEGGGLLAGNPPFFHYRIVTEAYALRDRSRVDAAPWNETGLHTVSVQVQRVIQLSLVELFGYAVFYAATGETGDLELEPESDIRLDASLHSNGAVYLGGAGMAFRDGDYKRAASDGGVISMGSRSQKVQVSGVMGVYRLRKSANVHFASAAGRDEPTVSIPREVPRPGKKVKKAKHQSFMSGRFDLNGGAGDQASEKISINGDKFTYERDSRSDWSLPENRFDPFITDARSGGTAIASLATVPQFNGHPLQMQRLVGQQVPLYRTREGGHYTIDPMREPVRALYYTAAGTVTSDYEEGVRPVYATDMPLFRFVSDGKTREDVWPSQPLAPLSFALTPPGGGPVLDAPAGASPVEPRHTWLPAVTTRAAPGPLLGYHLEKSLFGDDGVTTGLTIRERGRTNPTWRRTAEGDEVTADWSRPRPPEREEFPDAQTHVRELVAWLQGNYAVYLGLTDDGRPRDITAEFFTAGAPAAIAAGDATALVASPGRFVNRREARWLQEHGYFAAAAEHGPTGEDSARTLRARPFTLHLARVCEFLRTPNPAFGNQPPNRWFNGLIYVHRTPRLVTGADGAEAYAPLAPLRYHPIADPVPRAPDLITNTTRDFLVLGSVVSDATPAVGSPGSWVVYPLHLPVRIAQAQSIDPGPLPSGRPGLTIITPDPCYLQGSFNTVAPATGGLPPCALFADSVTLLSNRWSDAENDQDDDYAGPLPLASATELNLSLVLNNLPTDQDNVLVGGSGGVHNLMRYLEDWTTHTMRLQGSLVVLNRMRYSRAPLGEGTDQRVPERRFEPLPGGFGEVGRPPFAPVGVKVTRMISTVAEGGR